MKTTRNTRQKILKNDTLNSGVQAEDIGGFFNREKKKIIFLIEWGIIIGFFLLFLKAICFIFSHHYFSHKMFNLILLNFTCSINRGILYGIGISASFYFLLVITSLGWRKLFSTYFELKIIKKKKLTPLIKGIFWGSVFIYWFFQFFKFLLSSPHQTRPFLVQSLIVFLILFLYLQLKNISFQSLVSRIFNLIINSTGVKRTAIAVLSIFMLANLLVFSKKLFFSPSGPNVLLIVADALRADHLGCYGYNQPTSPYIDTFAKESLLFERAMSNASWTKPSMGTVFTSLYPHEHRAFFWSDDLSNSWLTLAEVFRNRNYKTYAIQTNPSITKNYNFEQGFQYYKEMVLEEGEKVTSEFVSWLKKNKNKPFFAYLHYMDTHVPYNTPDEFSQIFKLKDYTPLNPKEFTTIDIRILNEMGLSQQDKDHLINLYDGAVKYFNHNFERIIDNLKKLELFNKTLIVLTSDHGEEFWEHNGFAHGHTLYNEVLYIPLIIRYRSVLPAKRIKSYVQLLDLFPTILSIAGIKNDFNLSGKELSSTIFNDKQINKEIFFECILYGAEKKAVLKDGWKLIKNTGIKGNDTFHPLGDLMKYKYPEYEKGLELYNINQDFSENINQILSSRKIAENLEKYLLSFDITSLDFSKQKKTRLQKKLDDLKHLGYIK